MKQPKLLFALAFVALLTFGATHASAVATLRATVDAATVDLDSTSAGTDCADATACDSNASANIVHSSGSLAGVNVDATGTTKAGCVGCLMDLNTLTVSSTGAHTVDILLSDIGFTAAGGFNLFFSATIPTGGSATATLFGGNSNTIFDLSATRGGPIVPGPGTGTAATVNPYSLTERIQIVFGAGGGTFSGDFQVSSAVPEPTSIVLLGTLLLGFGTAIRRKVAARRSV